MKIPKEDMIQDIMKINPNAKKDELERLSGEHLSEVYEYWKKELRNKFDQINDMMKK